jgi:hypothetical protein
MKARGVIAVAFVSAVHHKRKLQVSRGYHRLPCVWRFGLERGPWAVDRVWAMRVGCVASKDGPKGVPFSASSLRDVKTRDFCVASWLALYDRELRSMAYRWCAAAAWSRRIRRTRCAPWGRLGLRACQFVPAVRHGRHGITAAVGETLIFTTLHDAIAAAALALLARVQMGLIQKPRLGSSSQSLDRNGIVMAVQACGPFGSSVAKG